MKRIVNIFTWIVIMLTGVALIWLLYLAMRYQVDIDWQVLGKEKVTLNSRPIHMVFIFCLVLALLLIMLSRVLSQRFTRRVCIIIGAVCMTLLGLLWMINNPFPVIADQKNVWRIGKALAGLCEADADNSNYLGNYPYQAGLAWIWALFMRLSGNSDPAPLKILNVICMPFMYVGIVHLAGKINPEYSEKMETITALIMMLFLPPVAYCSYLYGTLISLACVIWAIDLAMTLGHDFRCRTAVCVVILLTIANLCYGGTVIATIAVVLTFVIYSMIKQKNSLLYLITILVLLICTIGIRHLAETAAWRVIPKEPGRVAVPVTANIWMGISSDGRSGEGSHKHKMTVGLAEEYGEAAGAEGFKRIKHTLGEYIDGKRDISFFNRKTAKQWLEPTFGALNMTVYAANSDESSENFVAFASSIGMRSYVYYILQNLVVFVYLLAFISLLFLFRKKDISVSILPWLYFLGGFSFQLIWEQKPRYCMPYFIMLIPIAAYALSCIDGWLLNRKHNE